jgi:hypothetical protein
MCSLIEREAKKNPNNDRVINLYNSCMRLLQQILEPNHICTNQKTIEIATNKFDSNLDECDKILVKFAET